MKAIVDIVRKLNYIMNRKQKRQYIIVMFVALLGSMFELLGVSAILPFIESIITPEDLNGKWYYVLLVRFFHPEGQVETMTILGIIVVAVAAVLLQGALFEV